MSTGFVVCSECHREVHQDWSGGPRDWYHCEDETPRCDGATSEYPRGPDDVRGSWCGMDGAPPEGTIR